MAMKNRREFRSAFTREFFVTAAVNGLIALFLIHQGQVLGRVILMRGLPFLILGGVSLVFLAAITFAALGRVITFTPTGVEFRDRFYNLVTMEYGDISELYLSPPTKRFFRSAYVGDGRRHYTIDSFFFPDYEVIVHILVVARKQFKERRYTRA